MFSLSVNSFAQYKAPVNGFAQDKGNERMVITDIARVTFLNPGLSYEKRIGKFQSLYGQAFVAPSFSVGYSAALGDLSDFHIDPGMTFQYRYFYNYRNREAKGKRTEMNSMNYIGASEEMTYTKDAVSGSYYAEADRRLMHRFGAVWGLQRNFPGRFSVDFNIGLGYTYAKTTVQDMSGQYVQIGAKEFGIVGQLTLGLWLNKKKPID